jgi:hydrogenase expression/formation protein HypE
MTEPKNIHNDFSAGLVCPVPISQYPHVLLAHGGGGTLSHHLITTMMAHHFDNPALHPLHDGAIVDAGGAQLAFSTDSYVIDPLFFPGGNIGELAVYGTVNDLAMCGSTVTGDTKVVDRGKGDGIFINTAGIGVMKPNRTILPSRAAAGDAIIVSGEIAQHGIAIMSVRKHLEFETTILSDCAPLNSLVETMFQASEKIHVLRDPTRGGVASALNEIAESSRMGVRIVERDIPVSPEVRGACELLGFDPLYVANEGKLIAFVDAADAGKVLSAMHNHPLGKNAAIIGTVVTDHPGIVTMKTSIGSSRVVDMLSGEQLPRIC